MHREQERAVSELKTLREWRVAKLIGVKELAARAGTSNKTITDIEYGRKKRLLLRTVKRISQALDVNPRDIREFRDQLELMKNPATTPNARKD